MTDPSARFIGSIPENYDSGLGPHIFIDYARDIAARAATLGPDNVLELAAGTGIVTRCLRDALPDETALLATDLNPPMLDHAGKKFTADESVRFQAVDATDLPFDDGSFDAVVCQFGVMFFPDRNRSYSEVARVLRPGAHYLFSVWDTWEHNAFARIAHEVTAGVFAENPPGFYRVPFGYNDIETIRNEVLAAGFREVVAHTLPLTVPVQSAELLARGAVFGNPLYDEIIDRKGNPDDIHARMQAAFESGLGDSMSIQAIVFDAMI